MRRVAWAAGWLLAAVAAGCASTGPAPPGAGATAAPAAAVPDLESRALLLLMVDVQSFEPVIVEHAAHAADPALREATATALGRIGEPAGVTYLSELLGDPEPAVRRAAAFALGGIDAPPPGVEEAEEARGRARRALLLAVPDPDPEVGRLAAEALGKLGAPLADVVAALASQEPAERDRRLLPALFRFDDEAVVGLATAGLAADDPELHRWAAYALARNPRPGALERLRDLVTDADPRVRAWAARGLGIVGGGEDLARLAPLLADPDPGPVIEALRAGSALAAAVPDAAAGAGWEGELVRLLADARPQVRLAALEAAGPWAGTAAVGAALLAAVRRDGDAGTAGADGTAPAPAWERAAALRSLARAPGSAARPEVVAAVEGAAGAERPLRQAAADAAAALADPAGAAVLARLLVDPDAAVRSTATAAALGAERPAAAADAAATALVDRVLRDDPDAGVRAVVFDWLGEHPVVPYGELTKAAAETLRDGNEEASLGAVGALVARGQATAGERGGVVAVLEQLLDHRRWLVRRAAADGLAALGRPRPAVEAPDPKPGYAYEEVLARTAREREVAVVTGVGTLRLRLDCPRAPMTCLSFLDLAEQGFFDGLVFHRVVPDFVVQAGDPRGDGYGGPGYALRDEINRRRYRRGTLGMALAGPDTGGSQFFLCLAPQPHLDGGYTAFGEVVAGDDVLDRIVPGTVIEQIREVE